MMFVRSILELTVMASMAQERPFEDLLWKARILVVFEQNDEKQVREQRNLLPEKENEARELLIVNVPTTGKVEIVAGRIVEAEAIRQAYGIRDDAPFMVLLIGKDGGVKLRSPEPISAKQLYGTIDAMPMRRREASGG